MIRDAEVENTIRTFATPLFRAAGLSPSDVKIYIVKDDTLNAFVAGGQKLFINTGLILASDTPGQIIGVIAHETGHIAGGHLSRLHDELAKGSATSILSLLLGGAASIATGRGDVGAAIALGGHSIAQRGLLSYSRVQESAADHAAMRFLDQTGFSARGLLDFMETLEGQELLSSAQQDPYVRTHPLTRDRMDALRQHIDNSPNSDRQTPPQLIELHDRMRAKLLGFLNPLSRTHKTYKPSDQSLPSRYARAIGNYRTNNLPKALTLIDGLIAEEPENPYFHELKGQMLYENGRVVEALKSYGNAARLLPNSALIRRDLARVQVEFNEPAMLDAAIVNLRAALAVERNSAFNWRLIAIAYGRKGDHGRSSIALAEEALLKGKPDVAAYQANRAIKLFPEGSREWLQAEDIRLAAEQLSARRQKKNN